MSAASLLAASVLGLFSLFVCGVSGQSTGAYGFQTVLTSYVGAAGTAHAYLDASASVLVVAAQWTGLTGRPTLMHIHGCLPAPASLYNSSGVIINLTPTISTYGLGSTGETIGRFDLTQTSSYQWTSSASAASQQQTFLNCLVNGSAYFNIHTTQNPAGELNGIFQQTTQVSASWGSLTVTPGISVASTATGNTSFLYNSNTHEVFIGAAFSGLTSNCTGVHWHGCSTSTTVPTKSYIIKLNPPNAINQIAASFVNYYNLLNSSSFLDSSFTSVLPPSPIGNQLLVAEQTIWQCYSNGSTTINVHTQDNTGGEISSWYNISHAIQPLTVSSDALTAYTALLGAYGVSGAAGSPVGYAVATLDVNRLDLAAAVTVFSPGLTGNPTAGHIHGCTPVSQRFPFGSTSIMVPLNTATLSGTGTGVTGEFQNIYNPASIDTYYPDFLTQQSLTKEWWLAEEIAYKCLQNEQTYVNIHTQAIPSGEATGVLTPSNQVLQLYTNSFKTSPNVTVAPPTGATATAYVLWDMAAHLLWVNVSYSSLSSVLVAAHIHGCLPSTGIAIPLDITGSTSGFVNSINTASPGSFNSAFYTVPSTPSWPTAWYAESQLANCIYNNSLYINLHTNDNKGGEIQGALTFDANAVVPSTAPAPTTAISAAVQFTLSVFSILMPALFAVVALVNGF